MAFNASVAKMSSLITVLLLCMLAASVSGVRVKIQLANDFSFLNTQMVNGAGACSDKTVVLRNELTLYGNLKSLNKNQVKFWRSASAKKNLDHFGTMKVPGLKGTTVNQVFSVLRKGDCFPYYYGGAVRDQFLLRKPNDADVEVDCSLDDFLALCTKSWGKSNCVMGRHAAHIGNANADPSLEVMDVASTSSSFYMPLYKLEYAVNSLAYDTNGNDVVIDLAGKGVEDACDKPARIRIPSADDSRDSWETWLRENPFALFRYWKLRYKGLVAFNDATQTFIIDSAKERMVKVPGSFESFYCSYVWSGRYDRKSNICARPCNKPGIAGVVSKYDSILMQDLGPIYIKHLPGAQCKLSRYLNSRIQNFLYTVLQ